MKIYYLIALISTISIGACAQQKDWKDLTPSERATKLTDWMDNKLNLTDIQKSNIYSINLKYAEKTELLINSNLSRKEKFQTLKGFDEAKDKDLQKYLLKDQFKIYEDEKRDLKRKIRDNH